jgi:ribosome-associated protein
LAGKKQTKPKSEKLALQLAKLALTKKATDIKILNLAGLTTITDFFVICTGSSDTHIKAITDAIVAGSKKLGEKPWHKEGISSYRWVLLDYVEVVVHIFLNETRAFYGLEKLWGDAVVTEISDS